MTAGEFMRRGSAAALLLLAAACSEDRQAPTPDGAESVLTAGEILARAESALGGLSRLDQIRSIETVAEVGVDDSHYRVVARSLAKGPAYLRFEYPDRIIEFYASSDITQVRENGGEIQPGTAFHALFARGHQFHRWALFPQDDLEDFETAPPADFHGCTCTRLLAASPEYVSVDIYFDDTGRIFGERRVLDEDEGPHTIDFVFSDWEELDGVEVFRSALIDDMGRLFHYRFTGIRFNTLGPEDLEL